MELSRARVCPCHYRATCVVTDLCVSWMSATHVGLACRVDSCHELVKGDFDGLSLEPRRCAHDVTDKYILGEESLRITP